MASSNRQPQQKQPGDSKRGDLTPLTFTPDTSKRQTAWTEDDLLAEDDPLASNPPRPSTSAIRLNSPNSPTGSRRGTRGSNSDTTRQQIPVPSGRTGQAYPGPIKVRSGRNTTQDVPLPDKKHQARNMHWLLYVGVGMIAALALWVTFSSLLAWGTAKYNDIVYGYPRFYQTDAIVGHNDSQAHPSHFIALNLHGQVIVIELPGGNPAKSLDYIGPDLIANGDDLIPLTLSFSDVNHNGKPHMYIHIQDREVEFCNDGTKFTSCS
jgi:hypothetical protein